VSDTLSDRFRSMEEMQALVGVPALAIVGELSADGATGIEALQAYSAPNAMESEAFRTLRTALSFADQETHQLVVSSPEPGDGKTTVLANLGVAIAQSGKRVLLIDADLRRPGLTAMLGMRGIDGLSSLIRSDQDLVAMAKAHIRSSEIEGLDVLPSGPRPPNPAELLGSQRFSELLAWAESCYDQVLVDSPPTLATCDAAVVGRLVEGALLVVNPAKNRRRAVMRSVETFALMKIPLVGIVVNRISFTKDGYYGYDSHYGYEYTYGNEPGDPDFAAAAVEDDGFAVDRSAQLRGDDLSPPDGIVPRRVA
jgi:capsular exopolysaccharide synthesis family protein